MTTKYEDKLVDLLDDMIIHERRVLWETCPDDCEHKAECDPEKSCVVNTLLSKPAQKFLKVRRDWMVSEYLGKDVVVTDTE